MVVDRRARIGLRVARARVPRGAPARAGRRSSSTGRSSTASGFVWDSITTPAAIHAFWLTLEIALIAVPLNTVLGVITALALVRGRFRGKVAAAGGHRPAVRDLAGRHRPRARARLRAQRLVRRLARRPRHPDHLRRPGHGARDDLRVPAVRRARGRARAARDRRRAGAGGRHARRLALADVPARHAARDPLRASPTASCSRWRARSASSARSASCPARSPGQTDTLTLLVENRFQNFDVAGAYAASALLALIALATLLVMTRLRPRRDQS